jgi:formylglycine-generating enzyme required for sulfatase activity
MSDIFLSYARKDLEQAKRLAGCLQQQGWSVFWDMTIPPGKTWHQILGSELDQAQCVVVCWSNASIQSDWVREEAEEGRQRRILIPVLFEPVRPPLGFRSIQTVDFIDWAGNSDAPVFQGLIQAVADILGAPGITAPVTVSNTIKLRNPPQTDSVLKTESVYPSRVARVRVKKPVIVSKPPPLTEPLAIIPPRKPLEIYRDELKDGTLGPEMVVIPAGSFRMGGNHYDDEKPIHSVSFARPFAIGRFTVTFDEYDHYAQAKQIEPPYDSGWGRERMPVINVSWNDAVAYAHWLAEQTGKAYRLPSEAEWEYAARAGTETAYWWGDDIGTNRTNCDGSGSEWSNKQTAPVGSFPANPWRLHDTVGNVWEWVQDPWHGNYNAAPSDGSVWEQGGSETRVLRGGSWGNHQVNARASSRSSYFNPVNRNHFVGFRLACVLSHAFGFVGAAPRGD